jgi:hypothetical protein
MKIKKRNKYWFKGLANKKFAKQLVKINHNIRPSFKWCHNLQNTDATLFIYPFEYYVTSRGKGDYQIEYVPAPRVTEAEKQWSKVCLITYVTSFFRSLQRALDRKLYLLLYGDAYGALQAESLCCIFQRNFMNQRKPCIRWTFIHYSYMAFPFLFPLSSFAS